MEKLRIEDFDQEFIKTIEKLADALKVKPAVMLENIFIGRIASDKAERDVYFNEPMPIMEEFLKYNGEIKRGFKLYEMIYNLERERLEREYIANLAAVPWEALTEQDKVILTRRGIFPPRPGSKEKAEEQKQNIDELREKFNLPKNEPGKSSTWEE